MRARQILLIAEHAPTRQAVSSALTSAGFEVGEVSNLASALARIADLRPPVVVYDLSVHQADVRDLVAQLREAAADRELRVLALTSLTSGLDDAQILQWQFDGVIRKPCDAATLVSVVESALRRSLPDGEGAIAERQALMKRCSALAAELSILTRVSEAVLRQRDVETEFDDALAACFDPAGPIAGVLYVIDARGALRARVLGGERSWAPADVSDFFGQRGWLAERLPKDQAMIVFSSAEQDEQVLSLLQRTQACWALLAPLWHMGHPRGALFLTSNSAESARELTQWRSFAQGLSQQITLSLALADIVRELESAEREALEQRRVAREQGALWRALVQHAPDVILHLDRRGRVCFVNRTPSGASGPLSPEQLWATLASSEYRDVRACAVDTVISSGHPTSLETAVILADGTQCWVESHLGPITEAQDVTGVVVIERDVTQKKQTEAQLIVSDRLASVGTLAAGVAHEINNPLASVMANLDLALRDAEELTSQISYTSELLDELRDAREGAERVRRIVRDLRVFSRVDEDKRGPVDVERVLESTLRMAWNEIRHRARLVKEYGRVPCVEANESRLGQVFLNLLVNAAQAIEEGDVGGNEIRIKTYVDASSRVVVSIADTGSGIDPAIRNRLFTPFVTTKPVGVGTGLGLSICHRIVSAVGGQIGVESEPGRGSEFRVTLPPAPKDGFSRESSRRQTVLAKRRGRVMVVDDEFLIIRVVRRTLSREHEVVPHSSAEAALASLLKGERFDVILCDLMMPDLTGMGFYEALLKACPDQARRIVFLTGGAFTPRAREFLETVHNHRLEKPIDTTVLRALVNRLIE